MMVQNGISCEETALTDRLLPFTQLDSIPINCTPFVVSCDTSGCITEQK
jgi:hypothetical protein